MRARRVFDTGKSVYEAGRERVAWIFERFERVYLSFSGGKDSGVLLNLMIDHIRATGETRKLGVMVMDNETNYTHSLDFMHRIIDQNLDILDVHWCCLPLTLPCTVSAYQSDWQCWLREDSDRWIRPMPTQSYVISEENCPFEFFRPRMLDKEFYDHFGEWYSQGKPTAAVIGIRAAESLNRFRTIMNPRKRTADGRMWTRENMEHVHMCYPLYDWRTEDIWTANAINEWDYNRLYDIFYMSGVPVHSMRVASAFMSESKSSLNLYRVIDPQVWARMCARVHGANFLATYGKQLSYRSFSLPDGHTWKSFTKFLLDTLPEESSANFRQRLAQSIKFWGRVGRGLPDDIIEQLEALSVEFYVNGTTPHGGNDLRRVRIRHPPDHLDGLRAHPSMVTSWKRFAITILKNDHTCKYLGLQPTKEQAERQREIKEKYASL